MATVAELIADAEDLLDGSEDGIIAALPKFKAAAMLGCSQQDYESAERAARAAMALLTMTPDSAAGGRGVNSSLTWSAAQIGEFLNQMRSARRALNNASVQEVPVRYQSESSWWEDHTPEDSE